MVRYVSIATSPSLATFLLLLLTFSLPEQASSIECSADLECETLLRPPSKCIDGLCSNPFHEGGCLKNYLPDTYQKPRICHSEDPPDAQELGFCIPSPLDYLEVRIQGTVLYESFLWGAVPLHKLIRCTSHADHWL